MSVRESPRTFIGDPETEEAIYTSPVGELHIRDKLSNEELFEAIHPCEDGNGRTGRILNNLLLVSPELP